jgi:hypothetical protein
MILLTTSLKIEKSGHRFTKYLPRLINSKLAEHKKRIPEWNQEIDLKSK